MYRLSEKASEDLDDILDYSIIEFGVDVMLDYHLSLENCFELLAENPDLGLKAYNIRQNYFYFQHRSHLIFYKKEIDGILIVRLLHKSMNVPIHFN